ncbi:lantibiotic dehydratase [Saccharopolyspora shandongensis]|uniref:lantibiotic dehydratase n=1 Tax=Saccharopolyspora shandongensis TaxID=418495 RepID=UPI003422629F
MSVVEQLLDLDDWLGREGQRLAGELHPVIGGLDASADKAALVGLRRALHRSRTPAAREWNGRIAERLPEETAAAVRDWLEARSRRQARYLALSSTLAEETDRVHAALREQVAAPEFRRALSVERGALLDELHKWLAEPERLPKRHKLVKLGKYLARAAAKTSPYSSFMVGGFGLLTEGGSPSIRWTAELDACGVLDVGGPFLQQVRAALAAHPAIADSLEVRQNTSLTVLAGQADFLGRSATEPIVSVPAAAARRHSLAAPTVAEFRASLAADVREADRAKVGKYVAGLIESGLVEARIPVSEHAPEPFAALADWLDEQHGPEPVVEALRAAQDALRPVRPLSDVDGFIAVQAKAREALRTLAERLDLDERLSEELHETVVAPGVLAEWDASALRPALNDLDVVRRFLTVFGRRTATRIALAEYVAERFGAGARLPLLALYRAVQEALTQPEDLGGAAHDLAVLLGPWSSRERTPGGGWRCSRLQMLDRLRAQASAAVCGEADADGVIRTDPAVLAKQLASWPEWLVVPPSAGCYVQFSRGGRLVLNTVYRGHGCGLNRTRRLVELAGGPAPETPAQPSRTPEPAELSGLLGATLNLRGPGVGYEIDYPFTVSERPAAQRLPLNDLSVVHDAETGTVQVHSERLGRSIAPMHLGMSGVFSMPPLAAFLDEVFGADYLHPSKDPLLPWGSRGREVARVAVGRVVVQRASWWFPAEELPRRRPGEPDADYLLRLTAWRRAEALPERCFARYFPIDASHKPLQSSKPGYLDFANPYLVAEFERQLPRIRRLACYEALPEPDDATGQDPADPHVTELLIELTDEVDDA